jgi:hypothetical protein
MTHGLPSRLRVLERGSRRERLDRPLSPGWRCAPDATRTGRPRRALAGRGNGAAHAPGVVAIHGLAHAQAGADAPSTNTTATNTRAGARRRAAAARGVRHSHRLVSTSAAIRTRPTSTRPGSRRRARISTWDTRICRSRIATAISSPTSSRTMRRGSTSTCVVRRRARSYRSAMSAPMEAAAR